MALSPCVTGTVAVYKTQAIPVKAWADDGAAYVAGEAALVRADSLPDFVRLDRATTHTVPPHKPSPIGRPPVINELTRRGRQA